MARGAVSVVGAAGPSVSRFDQSALAAALRAPRTVNLFSRRRLLDNRQEAGAVAGRAYLLNDV